MEKSSVTLKQIMNLTQGLSPFEKLHLIEQLTLDLKKKFQTQDLSQRRSLRGILKGCSISAEDIDQARKEMWGNFPRGSYNA